MKLIDKSALVAEIERIENAWKKHCFPNPKGSAEECLECLAVYSIKTLNFIKDFLDTLEVKEVDLKKEFDNYTKNILACDVQHEPFTHLYNCAKHFFALGLKAQKGE